MLNGVFVALVLGSILLAAYGGGMDAVTKALLDSAKGAVDLGIGLVGIMAFFLGLMKVAEDGGLLRVVGRVLWPVLRRLFPSVPKDHPALHAILLNLSSNFLGLGNAATPFGIKAMTELDRLNGEKGTATDAMVLFLAINTSGLALLPSGVIGIRAALGSSDAAGIMVPTWIATGSATAIGITAAWLLSRLPSVRRTAPLAVEDDGARQAEGGEPESGEERESERRERAGWTARVSAIAVPAALVVAAGLYLFGPLGEGAPFERLKSFSSFWMLPLLVTTLVLFGWARGVRVYESLVEGAKEGFQVAIRIIPFLVAILVAVGMFRAAGGIELLSRILEPVTGLIGMPAEALPVAVMRPLSGSGALGVMTEIMQHHGPDSFLGYMVSSIYGSTETTFYVLAVYFGAVGVKRTRHAVPACLAADLAGILAGVFAVHLFFG